MALLRRCSVGLLLFAPVSVAQAAVIDAVSSLLEQLGLTNVFNGTVQIRVTGGSGRVGAYASMINNVSGDPLYIPAQ